MKAAVFLVFVLGVCCHSSFAAQDEELVTTEQQLPLLGQLEKLSSQWKVNIVANVPTSNTNSEEVKMNNVQAKDRSKVFDEIAIKNRLGWGELDGNLCFFSLSQSLKPPVNDPVEMTRHRMTYAARFFANLPQQQLDQLRAGEFIKLDQLPASAAQDLQTLVEPDSYSLEAPMRGFFAVSLGFAPHFAVVKQEEVAPLFRVFLLPDSQPQIFFSQTLDLQIVLSQSQKLLPLLAGQIKLPRNGLWDASQILALLSASGGLKFRLADDVKGKRIFLTKLAWSAQELLRVVLVVTNTRLSQSESTYVLNSIADPAEDLQTEQWFSHLCARPSIGELQINDRAGQNLLWSQLAPSQRELIEASLELTPPMKDFLNPGENRKKSDFRFSSGAKLQIGYYQTDDEKEKSPVLKHIVDTPLFDPWVSVDFFDQGGVLQ